MHAPRRWIVAALLATPLFAQAVPDRAQVVAAHAAWCHQRYAAVLASTELLQQAVERLVRTPDAACLTAARTAWLAARRDYGRTETLRFHDGPIEPLEPLLNAWPVDETHLDTLLADTTRYPRLDAAVLELANERGGEANVSTGWHAIEYLLWGRDTDPDGPGQRPAGDFDPGTELGARRGECLRQLTALLHRQLSTLVAAWAPDRDNHRRRFTADTDGALRRMLVGATVLTTFELGGERLTVAYDTRDQEQEHSCFSDATHLDLEANQLGLQAMLGGEPVAAGTPVAPTLLALLRHENRPLATALEQALANTLQRLRAIPVPFDRAILGADSEPGRQAVRAAIEALEAQSDLLLITGRHFGFELPLRPGD
jgi:putative iron-regulated protein